MKDGNMIHTSILIHSYMNNLTDTIFCQQILKIFVVIWMHFQLALKFLDKLLEIMYWCSVSHSQYLYYPIKKYIQGVRIKQPFPAVQIMEMLNNYYRISFVTSKRGTMPPNQKLACFVLYLKIINTFLKNSTCIF